jgi:DNA-directed RNA polymerase subunit F
MPDLKIISETPISMVDAKEKLKDIKKRDGELGNKGTKSAEYLTTFVHIEKNKADDLASKINALNIPRLRDRHIVKIIDMMPQDLESLKVIFTGDNITIKPEDLKRILDVIKENV